MLTCLVLGILLGLRVVLGAATVVPLAIWHSHKHLGHLLRTTPQARIVDSRWSALARTDVVALPHPGGEQYVAFTDGGAASVLVPLPQTPAEWAQVEREFGLFPYQTSPHARVLVIGAGGGVDVLMTLRGGAQAITAVEVNPDVLRAAERFIPPARNVYHVPTVQVVQGAGRHVIRQSTMHAMLAAFVHTLCTMFPAHLTTEHCSPAIAPLLRTHAGGSGVSVRGPNALYFHLIAARMAWRDWPSACIVITSRVMLCYAYHTPPRFSVVLPHSSLRG